MPGNGKSIVLESLAGGDTLIAVAVAVVLKPVLTALFIRAGAVGGMLTPALSTGVATGAFVALAVDRLGGDASVPTLALIGGAAVLAVTQRALVFAAGFHGRAHASAGGGVGHVVGGGARCPHGARRRHKWALTSSRSSRLNPTGVIAGISPPAMTRRVIGVNAVNSVSTSSSSSASSARSASLSVADSM